MMKDVKEASSVYLDGMAEVFLKMAKHGFLDKFAECMMARETMSAVDIVSAKSEMDLYLVRGQISICDELAKWAVSALEAHKEKAKSEYEEGIPDTN